jgi:chitinase
MSLLASWSYDEKTREMISYDTPEIVQGKIDFIKANGLGGGMWWDASGDRHKDDPQSLIALVVRGLGGSGSGMEKTQNILNFPQSSYDNIKNGMQQ